ncbi:OmpA family protein, partial [Bradyrhizobium sp. STM 3809]|uniref:OmpA family protein n=1 Tax=Bradyrhizobium sp. STM 3809 TaxID=551936 RepID=UPI000554E017
PLPALIIAPPLPPAVPAEPPAPSPVAHTEPPRTATTSTECFAPLAIAFERGSTRPNPADMKRAVAILQKALSRHADAALVIEGHADASGSEDLNVLLSYSRAKAVAELLRKDGVPAQQIAVRAAGAGAARGDADAVAGDRKALLRIAGVDDCDQLTAVKRP